MKEKVFFVFYLTYGVVQFRIHTAFNYSSLKRSLPENTASFLVVYRGLSSSSFRALLRSSMGKAEAVEKQMRQREGRAEQKPVGQGQRGALYEINHTAGTCPASGWQAVFTSSLPITMGVSS